MKEKKEILISGFRRLEILSNAHVTQSQSTHLSYCDLLGHHICKISTWFSSVLCWDQFYRIIVIICMLFLKYMYKLCDKNSKPTRQNETFIVGLFSIVTNKKLKFSTKEICGGILFSTIFMDLSFQKIYNFLGKR